MTLRTNVYVSVSDVRECDALPESEVATRRMQVTTEENLIKMDACEVDACQKLRKLHREGGRDDGQMTDRVVFKDMFGNRYNWVKESATGRTPHFAFWPGLGPGTHRSPDVSYAHEEAVENAARLIMKNKLKAVQICGHSTHSSVTLAEDSPWARGKAKCVKAFAVDGCGEGLTTVKDYYWKPDPNNSEYFKLDYAVLKNGELYIAIEVQRDHANSKSKREAFERNNILHLQVEANELNEKCAEHDWESSEDVVVVHHPITAQNTWTCAPCLVKHEEEVRLKKEKEAREVERKRKRDETEAPMLTTYDKPERNKYLKGFISVPAPKETATTDLYTGEDVPHFEDKKWFYLNETKYERLINPNPKCFRVYSKNTVVIQHAKSLEGSAVCLRLVGIVKPDEPWTNCKTGRVCKFPSDFVMFANYGDFITPGIDIPGVTV